jgi:predicted dehydrogenase
MTIAPFRVAIIGCGWAGSRHTRAFAECSAEVRWAIDGDASRAGEIAGRSAGARVSVDYLDALADPEVDAVDICLPHNLHAPVALAAARAGKHILTEKPLADTLESADEMIRAAEAAGVALMVAENERFAPVYHKALELLSAGVLGRPAVVQMNRECYLTRSFLESRRWFLSQRAAAGGMMMSGGVHSFATLLMLLGDVESVHALRAPQRFPEMQGDDTSVALIRFASGVVGTLVESYVMKSLATASGDEVHTLRIDGDLGHLAVTSPRTIRVFSEAPGWQPAGNLIEHEVAVPEADTFRLEVAHFIESVRSGAEPLTSGRSQRRPLEIVLGAYESMATGLPVHLGLDR